VRAPDWLTARPVAHRGLHDRARGIIENMPAAVQAAIDGNFSIEVDLQLTADGEAMVHHDDALGRLTEGSGALLGMTAAQLKAVPFKDTSDRMMSLGDLCALVAGRVPLVIEVKSHFDGDRKLVARMAEVLASYRGPVVGMSFDPDQVLALREKMPELPRGITAQRTYDDGSWKKLTPEQRQDMLHLRHAFRTRPHFVAFRVDQLPAPAPWIARNVFGLPLLTWTVRTPEQRERAARYADQMIFEGFRPGT
jgi:glycerophosphoryl diester phosphodiesterase